MDKYIFIIFVTLLTFKTAILNSLQYHSHNLSAHKALAIRYNAYHNTIKQTTTNVVKSQF